MHLMTSYYPSEPETLRAEIAAAAARLIAEDGADYSTAKRKAARQILGGARPNGDYLPDNGEIEQELRLYNELFLTDTQPARLLHLRQLALSLMQELAQFQPFLTGAVLNGTAGEYSDIHLQLFADSAKDVEIYLLNKNIQFDVSETPHFKGNNHQPVETVSFMWQREGVHLVLYQQDDLRGAVKLRADGRLVRADQAALRQLIDSTATSAIADAPTAGTP
jgi:hypothetical protein